MFCSEEANKEAEKKKKQYRRKIQQVYRISFKDSVIKIAEARGDRYGRIVKNRINFEHDLVAAGAKYHSDCFTSFVKIITGDKAGRPLDENIVLAMEDIFDYIENNEDCQFTLGELKEVFLDYVLADKTIISKLIERYGKNIIITKSTTMTIICFRYTQANIFNRAWYENKKSNPVEKRLRIVETAAAIERIFVPSLSIPISILLQTVCSIILMETSHAAYYFYKRNNFEKKE